MKAYIRVLSMSALVVGCMSHSMELKRRKKASDQRGKQSAMIVAPNASKAELINESDSELSSSAGCDIDMGGQNTLGTVEGLDELETSANKLFQKKDLNSLLDMYMPSGVNSDEREELANAVRAKLATGKSQAAHRGKKLDLDGPADTVIQQADFMQALFEVMHADAQEQKKQHAQELAIHAQQLAIEKNALKVQEERNQDMQSSSVTSTRFAWASIGTTVLSLAIAGVSLASSFGASPATVVCECG